MVRIDQILLTRVLPDLIESDVRKGDRKMLDAALGQLAQHVEVIKTPLADALLARSEALAATGPEAEAGFIRAIELLSNPKLNFELAKTQLLYGEWLRRQGRRRDARPQLQVAYEELDALGLDHLAERARIELAATGEHPRKRTYDTQDDLTPQEAQVARMAVQGARNTEIAHRLFISPATVEYHLSKVYRKLGIDSRAKLVRSMLLADSHDEQEAQALTG
jgi:DNA-binding CsgD family transcriptional regulator